MPVVTKKIKFKTRGEVDILDITKQVNKVIQETPLKDGIATVFVAGATGAITTIEYEPGLIEDLPNALEKLAPKNAYYKHHEMWHDGNGHSHVRASILGPSLTVPFNDKRLILGTWQQIVFLELDVKPRSREITVQIIGE
jgi:secondary thiamine-phosphate synthase enzyme